MADKPIGDLTPATAFTQSDLLVMEQGGVAKSVTGQVLMKDLAKMLDGHGGIKNITLVKSEGFVDTYEITTADGTKFQYSVTNGRDGIDGEPGPRGPSGTPYNWLDNSFFVVPVYQRGETQYRGEGPAIDRWSLVGRYPEMDISSGGVVKLSGQCRQIVNSEWRTTILGKTVTIAARFHDTVLLASGVLDVNGPEIRAQSDADDFTAAITLKYDKSNADIVFDIFGNSQYSPRWVAIYEGEYTAENLPDYKPKGYAAELLECQRYYRRYPASNILAMGYTDAEGKVLFSIPVSTGFKREPVASELTGAKIIVDGDVITITDKIIPQVTSLDFNAVHFSLGDDFVLSDKPNKMVAISNVTVFELSVEQ